MKDLPVLWFQIKLSFNSKKGEKMNYNGVHLWVRKSGYTHHGLGIGNGKVIHYSGLANGLEAGPISKVS